MAQPRCTSSMTLEVMTTMTWPGHGRADLAGHDDDDQLGHELRDAAGNGAGDLGGHGGLDPGRLEPASETCTAKTPARWTCTTNGDPYTTWRDPPRRRTVTYPQGCGSSRKTRGGDHVALLTANAVRHTRTPCSDPLFPAGHGGA